jgi:hypothetical protein
MFNPDDEPICTTIQLTEQFKSAKRPTHAQRVDFESNPLEPAQTLDGGAFSLSLKPKQIVTVHLG